MHGDAVSCLAISNTELQLISGSHDGSLKVWDLRKFSSSNSLSQDDFKPLYEIQAAHLKKYDEGVQSLSIHHSQPFIASGGSDSVVKVFELFA